MSQTKAQLLDGSVVSVAFSAGSAATPSLYFAGDLNTGIYSPGTDQVAVATNGTGRLFVDAAGNVGIGASPSGSKLEVNGGSIGVVNAAGTDIKLSFDVTGVAGGAIGFNDSGTTNAYGISDNTAYVGIAQSFPLAFSTAAQERLRITSAGLVGIGTSSPGKTLDVTGTARVSSVLTMGSYIQGTIQLDLYGDSSSSSGVRIDSSGRVGIGTTSPDGRLHVLQGTTPNIAQLYVGQGGGSSNYYDANNHYFRDGNLNSVISTTSSTIQLFTSNTERARIDSSGRVGIGTTVANSKLSIGLGSSTNDGLTLTFTGDNSTVARFFADTATGQVSIGGIGASYFPVFYAGAAEKARIDTSGRLLVGTSSARSNFFNGVASAALQLEGTGTNRRAAIIGDDFEASLILASQKSGAVGGNTVLASGDPVGAVSFQGNDGSEFVEAATITAFVDGTPGANDMPGRLVFSTTADGAATPTERLRIDSSGRLLVGTSTTGLQNTRSMLWQGSGEAALYINHSTSDGSGDPFIKFGYNGGEIGSITQSGTTAVAYNTSSDYRLKENVTPVTDGITRLQQLNPSRFNFIADPAKTVDGFIAHEVQVVVPEAITGEKDAEDDDGNPIYQGIDQSKLVPLLTAALQEAIAKIESLEARLTAAGI